jgi:glycine/D-amino acid oxidase-like deaminating enzyme
MAASEFEDIQNGATADRIFIIGGGIAGSALAYYLSIWQSEKQVVVLDKSLGPMLQGSTAYAPGFVGQLNVSSVLTTLAKDSVEEYVAIPGAFETVGGLEIATTPSGVESLRERFEFARQADLPAELITADQAAALAPDFVKQDTVAAALHFPTAGTANPGVITSFFRQGAEERGAQFIEVEVNGLKTDSGTVTGISTTKGTVRTHSGPVIIATGIWTQSLLCGTASRASITRAPLPIIPVAHPYTFTHPRPRRTGQPYAFVRWPEVHGYARDHGDCDGLGTYNHPPIRVALPFGSAQGEWPQTFESVLAEAASTCLKNGAQFLTRWSSTDGNAALQRKPFNGIFAVTPDNLPLVGKAKATGNLWLCAAVWVTHAAGAAKLVARQLVRDQKGSETSDRPDQGDQELLSALDPDRFRGNDEDILVKQALSRYNDIYNSESLD